MLICFFTLDEILGRAGLKVVLSVFEAFCSCGCNQLLDVGWLVRDLHLSVGNSG